MQKSGVREGLVLVNAMHITASVYVNDAEPGLIQDYQDWLETLVDMGKDYRHNLTGEDNAYAHLARTIADLAGEEHIAPAHIAEAIQYRQLDRPAGGK